jgi:hypothetical protein
MKLTRALGVAAIATIGVAAMFPTQASAGPSYSCKRDKQLDTAMQFAITEQAAGKLHVSAYGGSDKSTVVTPSEWRIYNAAGAKIDYFPKALMIWVSMNMFKETNIDGLEPGATYTVELVSKDFCNNAKSVSKTVTMPLSGNDAQPPDLSAPGLVAIGMAGSTNVLNFTTDDDSGTGQVSVFISGDKIADYVYENNVNVRWWTNDYPDDNSQSTLEGPNYYIAIPDKYKGGAHDVEVVVTDVNGNQSTTNAILGF